jgi:hypothetical protein
MPTWLNINPHSGGGRTRKMQEFADVKDFPDGEWLRTRPVGPLVSVCYHWIRAHGSKGGLLFPKICLNFDPLDGSFSENRYDENHRLISGCPWCDSPFSPFPEYWSNFIIRDLQDNPPNKRLPLFPEERQPAELLGVQCRFKTKGSKSWTPVRASRITQKLARKLQSLTRLNVHTNPKTGATKSFDLSHPRRGMDVLIYHDVSANRYDAQRGDQTQLTEEEQRYLWQPIDCLKPDKFQQAVRDYNALRPNFITPHHLQGDEPEEQPKHRQPFRRRNFWDRDDD